MKEFAIGDFERSPPHLFLYLFLFKRKTKVEKKTLPVLNTGESKLYPNKKQEVLEAPDFIYIFFVLLLLFSFHLFIFLFWDGKVDLMGNLAG